jgi:hypothetical protein
VFVYHVAVILLLRADSLHCREMRSRRRFISGIPLPTVYRRKKAFEFGGVGLAERTSNSIGERMHLSRSMQRMTRKVEVSTGRVEKAAPVYR